MSPFIGPSYHEEEGAWREGLEHKRAGLRPFRERDESQDSMESQVQEVSESDKATEDRKAPGKGRRSKSRMSPKPEDLRSQETPEALAKAEAWNEMRRRRYLGPGYGEEEELQRLEARASTMSPFLVMRPLTRPRALPWKAEAPVPVSRIRKGRSEKPKRTPSPNADKIDRLLEVSAEATSSRRTEEVGTDDFSSVDPKVLQELAECFERNGYVKWRDDVPGAERRGGHRHGVELRLAANSDGELKKIRELLKAGGFKVGSPFRKGYGYRQPLYGRNARKFVELLRLQGQTVRRARSTSGAG